MGGSAAGTAGLLGALVSRPGLGEDVGFPCCVARYGRSKPTIHIKQVHRCSFECFCWWKSPATFCLGPEIPGNVGNWELSRVLAKSWSLAVLNLKVERKA